MGKGTKKDYENIDVKGKLVLIDLDSYIGCQIGICAVQARQKGAYGIIAAPINENQKLPADALMKILRHPLIFQPFRLV